MAKYLDEGGLTHAWENLKPILDNKTDIETVVSMINSLKISLNGEIFSLVDGVFTLPDYPIIPTIHSANYISHRGNYLNSPSDFENVILLYEAVGEIGYYGAECDISETIDGKFVLMHDASIGRTTNGSGIVNEMTFSEISEVTIDTGNIYQGNKIIKIPTIEEYLEVCSRNSIRPVIELKHLLNISSVNNLLAIITSYVANDCTIIFFNIEELIEVRKSNQEIELHFLKSSALTTEETNSLIENNIFFSCNYNALTENLVKDYLSNNIVVGSYTVDDPTMAELLKNWGVSYITTNSLIDYEQVKEIPQLKLLSFNEGMVGKWNNTDSMNINNVDFFDNSVTNRAYCGFDNILGYATLSRTDVGDTDYKATILFFDKDGDMLTDIGWATQGEVMSVPVPAVNCIIYASKSDGSDFTSEELLNNEKIQFEFNK